MLVNIGKWFGYNYENKSAVDITSTPIPTQDEIRSQLRNPIEKKPDGYKNTQSSGIRFLQNTNLSAN